MENKINKWIFLIFVLHGISGVLAQNCSDPCDKPMFCTEGLFIANPDDCSTYFWCVNSQWLLQTCKENLEFDNELCKCNWPNSEQCAETCPTTTPRPTHPPAPCEDTPEPCVNGELYADIADCTFFYECVQGELRRMQCNHTLDGKYHNCLAGRPCVFDIELKKCVQPSEDFNCYYRCLTTVATVSEPHVTPETTLSTPKITTVSNETTTRGKKTSSMFDETTAYFTTKAVSYTTADEITTEDGLTATETPKPTETPSSTSTQPAQSSTAKSTTAQSSTAKSTAAQSTMPSQTSTPDPTPSSGVNVGAIVGGLLGLCAAAGVVIILLWIKFIKPSKIDDEETSSQQSTTSDSSDGTNDKQALVITKNCGTSNMLWRSAPGVTKGLTHHTTDFTFSSDSKEKPKDIWAEDTADVLVENPVYEGVGQNPT